MNTNKVVVCSGYFNPLHAGHIEYIQNSKELAGPDGKLIVIVNSDEQAVQKHGYSFMPVWDRVAVVSGLKWVDEVVVAVDKDRSVNATLELLCERPIGERPTHFTNAGDQTNVSIAEYHTCIAKRIKLVDGLGAKIQSSRWIISDAMNKINAIRNGN
jgi:cytidyltransferase-like protein